MIEWGCLELEHFYLGLRLGGGGNWCPSSYETLAAYVHFILICKTKDTASRRQTELKGAFCFCIRSLICGRAPIINVAIWYLARLIDYLLKDVQQQKLCACILMMLCAQQPQPLRLHCPPSSYLAIALEDRQSCWCWCKSPHCHYPPDLLREICRLRSEFVFYIWMDNCTKTDNLFKTDE